MSLSGIELFAYPIVEVVRSERYEPRSPFEQAATARLELMPGRDQAAFERSHLLLIGAGANGEVGRGWLRTGGIALAICDPDFGDLSNTNRQILYPADLGEPKAHRVAINLAREAVNGSDITSIALPFPEALAHLSWRPTVISCLVDDNASRLEASRWARAEQIPVVIAGLSRDGQRGYAFLQTADSVSPCLACAFPEIEPVRAPCVAACIKSVYLVAAQILHFIDIAIMGWVEDAEPYNLWLFDLNGRIEARRLVERNPDCWGCR